MTVVAIHLGAVHGARSKRWHRSRLEPGRDSRATATSMPTATPTRVRPSTLVEGEVVDEVGLAAGGTRRQLTVRGVRLNDLIGRRFRVGSVECYGVKLCEPCLTLEGNTRPGIIRDLVHRAGINADILNDGTISVGDAVTTTDD